MTRTLRISFPVRSGLLFAAGACMALALAYPSASDAAATTTSARKNSSLPRIESSTTPEHVLTHPLFVRLKPLVPLSSSTTPASTTLIPNGSFERGNGHNPSSWVHGGYGTNTRTFAYPVAGVGGSRAAQVTLSNRTNGDAKWYFPPIALSPGTYVYTDAYHSDVPSILTVQFTDAHGTNTYKDIAAIPASSAFATAQATFTVPASVVRVSVFHLITQNGTLVIDNAGITPAAAAQRPTGVFDTGAVTYRFDDGWLSQLSNAVPVLDSYGNKATFYIVTRQTLDNEFSGFMSIAQIKALAQKGEDIGAHTQTHPDLTTLSASQQDAEIRGSRNDLISWGITPATTFAYPYGRYDSNTLTDVKRVGFTSAAASIEGDVTASSDPYQLEDHTVMRDTSLAQVKQWVDQAAKDHTWLILTFHEIDTHGVDDYAVTPAMFSSIASYVAQKRLPVVTVSQGVAALTH